ncbi:MAG: ATP-binding protein [Clostridia bacterium]|nr:ATP-binding protein [Clostridia bacterium]
MININNKSWEKLRFSDIEKVLSGSDDETFFFEFKNDNESPSKLIKEISAFSNTYGGYIFLGINDDKTVGGCKQWTEQRIHTTIHDSITPIPDFDVKKFKSNGKFVFVIKINEGSLPPYITNKGQIYERVSSGSFPIKDSAKLTQLYHKREDQLKRIKNKIELENIDTTGSFPNNLCGYLDVGVSVARSEYTELQKNFYSIDLKPIADYLKTAVKEFSISRLAHSYLITLGRLSASDHNGNEIKLNAGIQNFIEIMSDGSVKFRIVLHSDPDDVQADITGLIYFRDVFKNVYSKLFGDNLSKIFVYAHKYEQLTVIKQFRPFYSLGDDDTPEDKALYAKYLINHQEKYGDNLIVLGGRYPKNDYLLIDKRYLNNYKIKFNTKNIINEIFLSQFTNLGYIDRMAVD